MNPMNRDIPRTNLSAGAGIGLFVCFFAIMLIIVSFLGEFVTSRMTNQIAAFRILTVVQDLLVFILPAIVTAMLMTKLPARFLNIEEIPHWSAIILATATLIVSMPFLNCVIEWNSHIVLPDGMKEIEAQLRALEESAEAFINSMLQGASVASLILSIAIIGVLAGVSEELFFRGALQKLLLLTKMNHHVAIWLGAVIFSAFHFQFFGFVPRMLLGAYFGYLVWWTKSLWVPIIIHSINNSIVVIEQWRESNSPIDLSGAPDNEGNLLVHSASFVLMVIGLYFVRKNSFRLSTDV